MNRTSALSLVGLLAAGGCGAPVPESADLVLRNGNFVTLDPARPRAAALAARGGRIVAVGSDEEIAPHVGDGTEVIDLGGRLAIPGFVECHGHFTSLGEARRNVDLTGVRSWTEAVDRVAAAAAEAAPGAWVLGRGWHQEKWDTAPEPAVEGYPTHEQLSRAVPDRPVLLTHASGHAAIANAAALERAGIDARTPDPDGGSIVRDAAGNPTGVLRETAENLVSSALERDLAALDPAAREAAARDAILRADAECLEKGVTSFQDAGSSFETIDRLRAMVDSGDVRVRLWIMLSEGDDALAARAADYRTVGERLTVRAIKRYADGALGSRGAWMIEPYSDMRSTTGLAVTPLADLEHTAAIALAHDLQLCVHAIGDRANREVLDLYERATAGRADGHELRWRIEHAQHLRPEDVPRFAELGVIASMQAVHAVSDGPWVPERIGPERAASGAYVWRSLLDAGAAVCSGTDTPVEDVDPIANFHAAVTRRMVDGRAFHPEQALTREEALAAATLAAARAAFEESDKGSLAPGKLADVVVLSEDILSVPDERIRDARVLWTIVGGEVAYRAPDAH